MAAKYFIAGLCFILTYLSYDEGHEKLAFWFFIGAILAMA